MRDASRRTRALLLTGVAMVAMMATPTPAAEATETLPEELAELVTAAQDQLAADEPQAALATLAEWGGDPHPVLALVRGHAAAEAGAIAEAEAAYRTALDLRPGYQAAGRGLIRLLADGERWRELRPLCGRFIDPASAEAPWLKLFVQVAERSEDTPLAEELARIGMRRFPDDPAFRRLLVVILLESGRHADAESQLRYLLATDPGDARLWRQLAATLQYRGDDAALRAAVEAALLADPERSELRAHLLALHLEAGQHRPALAQAERLLADSDAPAHRLLAARAALAAGALDRAATWLTAIPEAQREREHRMLAARIAVARGDLATARAAFEILQRDPALDSRVLLWAAQVEREAGAHDRAEALLRRAIARADDQRGSARLHLAHLLLATERRVEAAAILRDHLAEEPGDRAAQRMLAIAQGE